MPNYSALRLLAKADDHHAARATTEAATRAPPRYAIPPDEIELPCCTAEWHDDAWHHERSCIRAGRPAQAG